MTVKGLIKKRNLRFLHPDIIIKSDDDNITSILKAIAYFRNFAIFKTLYTLLYKSRNLSLEQYRDIYNMLIDYKTNHPKDYFIDGFSIAIKKSNTLDLDVKSLYAIMIYNQLNKGSELFNHISKSSRRLEKAVEDYYKYDRAINIIAIRNNKILKIGNGNIIKSIIKCKH